MIWTIVWWIVGILWVHIVWSIVRTWVRDEYCLPTENTFITKGALVISDNAYYDEKGAATFALTFGILIIMALILTVVILFIDSATTLSVLLKCIGWAFPVMWFYGFYGLLSILSSMRRITKRIIIRTCLSKEERMQHALGTGKVKKSR